jgi:uncharacterized protein (DUF58 family)
LSRVATSKVGAYAGLAALGLLAALATGLPELVVLAAPFAISLGLGLLLVRDPELDAKVMLERDHVLEGEEIGATIELTVAKGAERVELLLDIPPVLVTTPEYPRLLRLRDGEESAYHLRVKCSRWGAYGFGRLQLRTHDAFGMFRHELVLDCRQPLKVYPREEAIRQLLRPRETQVFSGNHVARQRGEGIEFADLRPFVAGDRMRHVNWRASARRGELWVNEHHPERNADVVIFLDVFAEARRGGRSTLDPALRAAASLVGLYLRQRDRVGFVSFGGMLNWLLPSTGNRQLYRIVDAMLDTQILLSYAWRDVAVIPRRTLPPHALIVALTPLLDDRAAGALLDLRARGFDLVVIEVSPSSYLSDPKDELEVLADRLWQLRREALRDRFARAGIPVAVWEGDSSLAAALEEVSAYHRFGRLASA